MKRRMLAFVFVLGMALVLLLGVVGAGRAAIAAQPAEIPAGTLIGYTGASTNDDLVIYDVLSGSAQTDTVDLLPEGNYPYDATLNGDKSELWIVGASGEGVVVVDTAGGLVTETIPGVGNYPVDVLFSADGSTAYVSNRDTVDDIKIIDTAAYSITGTIAVPDYYLGPGKMRLNPCTGELYVVNWFDDRFFVIDPISQTVTVDIPLGDSLWDLTLDPTASTLYITDRGIDQVHVLDADTQSLITSITVGDDPWGIDISPDGKYVLTANEDNATVSVIETASNTVTTTISLPADADPRDVEITEDGRYAVVPSGDVAGMDAVYVIDLSTLSLVDTILMPAGGGANPNVVAIAPDFQCPVVEPELAISKTGPAVANAGEPVTYTLTVTNSGTLTATGLVVTDVLPAGANYVSGGTLNGSVVNWNLASLGANTAATFQFVVTATATITNDTYNVTAGGGFSATGTVVVVTVMNVPELAISKTGPVTVTAGDPISYTLVVTNNGTGPATGLVVMDTLPAGANYVSGGTLIGDVVNWDLASLGAGSAATFQFVVTATETITNDTYGVSANFGFQADGTLIVVTVVIPSEIDFPVYLPVVLNN